MATPTQAELEAQLKAAIDLLEETRKFAKNNTPNWIGLEDAFVQTFEGDFTDEMASGLSSLRSNLANLVSQGTLIVSPVLRQWGKLIGAPENDIGSILTRMFTFFVTNSITVKSRTFVFNAPTKDANNKGDGVVLRLSRSEDNFDLENQTADAKTLTCVEDANTGASRNNESFVAEGSFPGIDILDVEGAGSQAATSIGVLSSVNSVLSNLGFDSFDGTASAPTAIGEWETLTLTGSALAVSAGNMIFDSTNIFLPKITATSVPTSLSLKTSAELRQRVVEKGLSIDESFPVTVSLPFNKTVGTASGTLTVILGTASASILMSNASAGWNRLTLGPSRNNWFREFNVEDLALRVRWARTSGNLLIDDMVFSPMTQFDNGWYSLLAGQTPFLSSSLLLPDGDNFSWADTISTDSVIQRWMWLLYNFFLPHSLTPSIVDP